VSKAIAYLGQIEESRAFFENLAFKLLFERCIGQNGCCNYYLLLYDRDASSPMNTIVENFRHQYVDLKDIIGKAQLPLSFTLIGPTIPISIIVALVLRDGDSTSNNFI